MTFLLVHGATHGAWCWQRLQPFLAFPSLAIDLPGRGTRPAALESIVTNDWAEAVCDDIATIDGPVVLVGHSLAGVVLPRVAARLSERLAALVFVACAVPREGQAVLDEISPELRPIVDANRENATAQLMPEEAAREAFCNDMDEEQTRFVLDRLVPEAWGPMLEPMELAGLRLGVPATYIKLLQDRTVVPDLQDTMIANIGQPEVVELDAGHDAMVSRPERLAQALNTIAERALSSRSAQER
jgi:pimeloyl-ACP methyl ester carboxylesterase